MCPKLESPQREAFLLLNIFVSYDRGNTNIAQVFTNKQIMWNVWSEFHVLQPSINNQPSWINCDPQPLECTWTFLHAEYRFISGSIILKTIKKLKCVISVCSYLNINFPVYVWRKFKLLILILKPDCFSIFIFFLSLPVAWICQTVYFETDCFAPNFACRQVLKLWA